MNESLDSPYFDFVVVGGGVSGIVCVETLCELIRPSRFGGSDGLVNFGGGTNQSVCLISSTKTVKTTINLKRITNLIETFEVEETEADGWANTWEDTLKIVYDTVIRVE